jgi:hypothetical protein
MLRRFEGSLPSWWLDTLPATRVGLVLIVLGVIVAIADGGSAGAALIGAGVLCLVYVVVGQSS